MPNPLPRNLKIPRNLPRRQQGIALLTALVIAVLVVGIASTILVRQSYSIRQRSNYEELERAWQYARALELWAEVRLQRDLQQNQFDALTDQWAGELPVQDIEEDGRKVGTFIGKLEDLQSRLNLNNVVDDKGKVDNRIMQEVAELANTAGLPRTFAQVIADWIDADGTILSGDSAESDYYLSGDIPFRAADAALVDASELRLLRLDIPAEEKEKALNTFAQYVTTLPVKTTINVNTAPEAVLQATGLSGSQVSQILSTRTVTPFKTKAELAGALSLAANQQAILTDLDVKSSYFRLTGEVRLGRARVFVNSVLFREPNKPVRVIMRQFDRNSEPTSAKTIANADNTLTNTE